jgi:L-threonylcarbamoyladenylate synthase
VTAQLLVTAADDPDVAVLAEAAAALRAGEVVGIPTDTVYGLAVDPWRPGASARVFAIKNRPHHIVLPVLVAGEDQALGLAAGVGPAARRLMAAWWPGPLTIVVRRRPGLDIDLGADTETIGLRCAAHAVPRALTALVGPLATTSATGHGQPPLTVASELAATLAGVALVIDTGACGGAPSTVVDCVDATPRLLRAGALSWPQILATLDLPGGDGPPT